MILSRYASSSNESIECFKADEHKIPTEVLELENMIEELAIELLPHIQLSSCVTFIHFALTILSHFWSIVSVILKTLVEKKSMFI